MRLIAVTGALLFIATAAFSGCGGSNEGDGKSVPSGGYAQQNGESLTRAEFRARLNALCADIGKKTDALPTTWDEFAANAAKLRDIYEYFFAELKKMRPPATVQPTINKIVQRAPVVIKYFDEASSGRGYEDPVQFNRDAADTDEALSEIDQLLYSKLGATSCDGI